MGLYVITIAAFYSTVFSFVLMITTKQKPPAKWGDWPYSNNRFSLWLNKKREKSKYLGTLRIDVFHLIGLYVFLFIFVFSFIVMIIDVVLKQSLYEALGFTATIIICIIILIVPCLFEVFFVTWWSLIEAKSPENQKIKKIKQIAKRKKK